MLPKFVAKPAIGDCEACDAKNLEVWKVHGNMFLCADCRAKEQEAELRLSQSKQTQQTFATKSTEIQLVTDIHNAQSVAIVELHAAILADETIPEKDKQFTFVKKLEEHFLHLKEVVSARRKELIEMENELRLYQVNGQMEVAKLSSEYAAQFDTFNKIGTYPTKVKTVKPKAEKAPKEQKSKPSATARYKEAKETAAKYPNLTTDAILSFMVQFDIPGENAAIRLLELLGKK